MSVIYIRNKDGVLTPISSGGNVEDAFSPTATVTQTNSGAVISITDKNGTTTATITNGENGEPGIVWRGTWDSQEIYHLNDVVYYDGSVYVCIVNKVDLTEAHPDKYSEYWHIFVSKGTPGENYILTEADKDEIAEMAADLVEVPDDLATQEYIDNAISSKQDAITGVAGQFVVIGADGKPTTKTILIAEEATF